ncbi:hypothetical protein GCM10014713_53100 [Streptomyces purpureus]|uniref:Putative Flp pilus-assembly TadG-like N-terminal domain-containing protein n=1 Tax=Streptomyces purpureus TaxID=1951 RepID=A0A918HC79_9ACTN|nr:hypothetical protein GCM10014713_53100 [Streptomyces purpureus]
MVGGLLFLAFAYFAVGQAAATRNGAQTAADAAALAAAQDAREQLRDGWLEVILNPAEWKGFLNGRRFGTYTACLRAESFANRNGAELTEGGCDRLPRFDDEEGFTVKVRTLGTVGESVIPGTENRHATAKAKAVIEPRCTFDPPKPPPTEDPDPGEDDGPGDDTDQDPKPILGLSCDGVPWEIDPKHPKLPDAADLFTVRLAD